MESEDTIVNRVASSGLITIELEKFYHHGERVVYDIKDNLFQELILREKDFREFLKENNWNAYQGKNVAITCTADAIIPVWAYMLLATKIQPVANLVIFGTLQELENTLFKEALSKVDFSIYKDAKVVIKGCGHLPIPESAYTEITKLLLPHATSIMFGEPCSTVPVYKKSKSGV